jgi:hypothetical protein
LRFSVYAEEAVSGINYSISVSMIVLIHTGRIANPISNRVESVILASISKYYYQRVFRGFGIDICVWFSVRIYSPVFRHNPTGKQQYNARYDFTLVNV